MYLKVNEKATSSHPPKKPDTHFSEKPQTQQPKPIFLCCAPLHPNFFSPVICFPIPLYLTQYLAECDSYSEDKKIQIYLSLKLE